MPKNIDYSRFVSNGGDVDVDLSPPRTTGEVLAAWATHYGDDDAEADDESIRRRGGGTLGA